MIKDDIYNYLEDFNIKYNVTNHKAVCTMDELDRIDFPYKGMLAKNLFVRDDKKKNYYLISIKEDKMLNLKEFSKKYKTRRLSFASENDLMSILRLKKGSISPFGLLNDKDLKVEFYIDKYFINDVIGVHPNDNTATVWLKTEDLIDIIEKHGNNVHIIEA